MKAGWKRVKLGEIADLIAGFAFKSHLFGRGQDRAIKITNIEDNGIDCSTLPNVDIATLDVEKLERYLVKSGDYVLAMTGSIGKVGRIVNGSAYINQRVLSVRALKDTDHRFLYYVVKGRNFLDYMLTHIDSHSVQANISAGTIGQYEFDLPPLATQRRIAVVLGALDDKIELNRKMNANLEAQAQALFKSWFVDFEPFGGKMPKEWKIGTIEGMCEKVASGGTPKSTCSTYYEGENKWFSTKELRDGFLIDSEKHISSEAIENSAAKLFPRNSVLMAIYASPTVGRLGVLESESTFNQAAVGMIAKKDIGYPYLFLALKSERDRLNNLVSGAAQQNLNVKIVKNYKMVFPSTDVLFQFTKLTLPLFEMKRSNQIESRKLAETRDALFAKLMSGELEVA